MTKHKNEYIQQQLDRVAELEKGLEKATAELNEVNSRYYARPLEQSEANIRLAEKKIAIETSVDFERINLIVAQRCVIKMMLSLEVE